MKAEQLWTEYCSKKGIDINTPYEAWSFGEDEEGDDLLRLVLAGKKFGTASLYDAYEAEDALDELPKAGSQRFNPAYERLHRSCWLFC
jgi:uncharacterized protein YhfF